MIDPKVRAPTGTPEARAMSGEFHMRTSVFLGSVLVAVVASSALATTARADDPPVAPEPPPEATAAPAAAPEPAPEAAAAPAAAPAAPPAAAPEEIGISKAPEAQPRAGYKDGFFLESPDGAAKLKLGGYVQADSREFLGDDDDKLADQFTFRRIRLDIGGTLFDRFEFRVLPDFAGSKLVIQDAWLDLKLHPAFRIRAGKQKAPFGLERLQSATALHFVERGLPTAVAPNRDIGVQLWGEIQGGVVTWALGAFNGVADGGSSDGDVSDDKELAARVFVAPFAASKGLLKNIGIGGAVTYGDKQGTFASPDVAPYKTTGQVSFFTPIVGADAATTVLAKGTHARYTGQGYAYVGPVGLLTEVVHSEFDVVLGDVEGSIATTAWQVEGVFELTGEDASYKGVSPKKPFDGKGGFGGFELAARAGGLKVASGAFDDGFADPSKSARSALALGGGLRWHAVKGVRVYLDYERTKFDGGASNDGDRPTENVVLTRVQTVF
jgi:phosphate-selective porin OprO and OprP